MEKEVVATQGNAERAQEYCQLLEDNSRYFKKTVPVPQQEKPPTEKDFVKDMNAIGIGKTRGYNRDKYEKRPKVHNYELIGDPMRRGKEVTVLTSNSKATNPRSSSVRERRQPTKPAEKDVMTIY